MRHGLTGLLLLAASAASAASSPIELKLTPRGSLAAPPPPGAARLPTGQGRAPRQAGGGPPRLPRGRPGGRAPVAHQPGVAPSSSIALVNPGFSGFEGLNLTDQTLAGTGIYENSQGILEPPDQGLCVGNGFVVEPVNLALAIYDRNGTTLAGPVPLNQFFGLPPEFGADGSFGDFLSDPKCIYDWTANRWYVITILQIDVDPASGAFPGPAHTLIARSRTGDPTGAWDAFSLDATNDGSNGTPTHPGCPCIGDQPLLGFDENAIFITTNEFPVFENGFNGAQVYGIGKGAFDGQGTSCSSTTSRSRKAPPTASSRRAPRHTASSTAEAAGTEFFTSSLEFTGGLDDRVAVWAMTGTGSLNGGKAKVTSATRSSRAWCTASRRRPPRRMAPPRCGTS